MQIGHVFRILVVTLTLVGASSCSTRSFGRVLPRPSTRGTITRADLDKTTYTSAYHAIQSLRPVWLYHQANATISNPDPLPVVYLDGVRTGDLEQLHWMSADELETIARLSPADATTRFGTGHSAGAIDIRTRH
jgi:hypothetical protein